MIKSAVSKVMWVGRATVFLVGLAVILALVLGVATTALGANGDTFKVGRGNFASAVSTLTKSGAGPALSLKVGSGPPLAVNSSSTVIRLSADKLDGKEPRQLPGSVATTKRFAGELPGELAMSDSWVFAGPTVEVTTNASQRLLAAADANIGSASGNPLSFQYGMCYRRVGSSTAPVVNFLGNQSTNTGVGHATNLASFSPTATVVPGAGTWRVGFCARHQGLDGPDHNGDVSGWVQVVNQ
jgi:hypothetical protein